MSTRFCPNCGSENVILDDENHYLCHDCDYSAQVFPEKELIGEVADMEDDDEEIEVKKSNTTKVKKITKTAKKVSQKKKGGKKK